MLRKPCCIRSATVLKPEKSPKHRDDVRHVLVREAGPRRGAEHEVVLVRHRLHVARVDLCGPAEQAVAVERDARRWRRGRVKRRARDVAHERRARHAHPARQPAPVEAEAAARRARLREVARHRDVALDLARDAVVLGWGVVGDRVDEDGRRLAEHLEVLQVGVAERLEGVVADVEHAARQAALARNGEVPREVEAAALDAGLLQRLEHPLEALPALLDRPRPGADAVAIDAESAPCADRLPARVLQVAEGDDVALTLLEVARRADDQHAVLRLLRVRVELDPDRMPLARAGIDDDDRRALGQAAPQVRERRELAAVERVGRVEARHLRQHRAARAEAVGAVHVGRVDRLAVLVARHCGLPEREPTAGVRLLVALREEVVRPRELADGRIREVTSGPHVDAGDPLRGGAGRDEQQQRERRCCGRESPLHDGDPTSGGSGYSRPQWTSQQRTAAICGTPSRSSAAGPRRTP